VGEMGPSEFVVAILIADLASIPMQDIGIPLLYGLIPILTVMALEVIFSYLSLKSVGFRKLLRGSPVVLIENGKLLYRNLRMTRISVTELTEYLRESGVADPTQVQFAILETSGKITALRYAEYEPPCSETLGAEAPPIELPVAVISDGRWIAENLKLVGKDRAWVENYLAQRGCGVKDTLLLTLTVSGKAYLARREDGA
ncbi:MAG: DUF421 domain-containing protein, partial [Oscillospiraceae bacterium]|nr:DUF421 domain-containing protein [Oscillospiraceae bacterium]